MAMSMGMNVPGMPGYDPSKDANGGTPSPYSKPAPAPAPVDPTNPNGKGTFNPTLAPAAQDTSAGVDQAVKDFYAKAGQAGTDLRNVPNADYSQDPNAQRYYQEADSPIQSQFYKEADQTASYLARQGLGSSGINVAASQGLSNNKAALESQARMKATDMAMDKKRQSILDDFSTNASAMQPMLANKGIDIQSSLSQLQMQSALEAMRAQLAQNKAFHGDDQDMAWANTFLNHMF
jgi:hypothetical protein